MTKPNRENTTEDPRFGTAQDEQDKKAADQAALAETQKKTSETRPNSKEMAEHSTGINAELEQPAVPEMPNMPPA